MTSPIPPIPQTQILSEATLESLQEILNLDPEKYTTDHRITVIKAMREWQARIAAADAAGRRSRAPKLPTPQLQIAAPNTKIEDLV